jgi:putative polyketide hydroxylase
VTTPPTVEVPVLIVGGGPVGLTASILLSRHGVRSRLVERHLGTSVHPKARGINARTMEIYRQCGVEQAIRDAGLPPERAGLIVWARTLAGPELERRVPWRSSAQSGLVSAVRNCLCAQDDLEPVLRRFAERLGPGELSFGTELLGFEQDDAGVTATLLDRGTGAETRARAQYLIAASGAESPIRKSLGVAMIGREAVYESVNILLRADLTPWTWERPATLYFIEQPRLKATSLTINGVDRWGFLVNSFSAHGLAASDFTPARCVELIRGAVGAADLPVEILGIAPWTGPLESPSDTTRGASSWRATRLTRCRRRAASGSTPGSRTRTISRGSSRRFSGAGRRPLCSRPTTPSGSPWGG